jgi:hypothetical protein
MRRTGVVLLRCCGVILLAMILVLTGALGGLGWLLTMSCLPVAEWAKSEIKRLWSALSKLEGL